MTMGYRVVLFLTCWLALWVGVGAGVGEIFLTPGTGAVWGFVTGVVSTFLWPWIIPRPVDEWLDGLKRR
jgi:hypothetical protein